MKKVSVPPSNSIFGVFFTSVFILSSLYFYVIKFNYLSLIFSVIAFYFLLITLFKSNHLAILNSFWFKFGILIGKITSPVILGIIFYLIISPVAIVLRLAGRDELEIRESKKPSSWKKRNVEVYKKDNFYNQY